LYNEKRRISGKRVSQLFQFTWRIRCVIMTPKSPRNLPTEPLNELDTHLILQT
jgi:hypothetical protein